MEKETARSIKVGLFVIIGVALLIAAIYFIGSKRSIFGSNIRISAAFKDVNGLQRGNNVRFAGINVGTVDEIIIRNDSSILVMMTIEQDVQRFIKDDAVATIGSDGLMGNRLVNISIGSPGASAVKSGDRIPSTEPVQLEQMLRVLGSTNERINEITGDVKEITAAINSGGGAMGKLINDTITSKKLEAIINNLERTTSSTAIAGNNLADITYRISQGKGALGKLVKDTILENKLDNSLSGLEAAAMEAKKTAKHLSEISGKMAQDNGTIDVLSSDTSAAKLQRALDNIEEGTAKFSENMEALQHNFLFRRYFRKKKKHESD